MMQLISPPCALVSCRFDSGLLCAGSYGTVGTVWAAVIKTWPVIITGDAVICVSE